MIEHDETPLLGVHTGLDKAGQSTLLKRWSWATVIDGRPTQFSLSNVSEGGVDVEIRHMTDDEIAEQERLEEESPDVIRDFAGRPLISIEDEVRSARREVLAEGKLRVAQ